ncbi:MAG: hypothetical protein IKU07_09620 [Oscillospiraceae bacterium]|nr:hypothetical protein [Oscillospiraceae bacterium]
MCLTWPARKITCGHRICLPCSRPVSPFATGAKCSMTFAAVL